MSQTGRPSPSPRRRAPALAGLRLPCFRASRGGNVAMIFALVAPLLILAVGGVVDLASILNSETHLQDATDAAALAASAAVTKNPNATEAALKVIAQNVVNANAGSLPAPTITDFHVCAPVQGDCTSNGVALANETVTVATSTSAPCFISHFVGLCTGAGGTSRPIAASSTTTIGVAQTIAINLLMDTSASMIVGATSADVTTISNWVAANWSKVKPSPGSDTTPCAFACHDVGGATGRYDVGLGLTYAHQAGATTRFDVMISAAQQLVNHIHTETTSNNQLSSNTYLFNVAGFDSPSSTNASPVILYNPGQTLNTDYNGALAAISSMSPGLDTHMDDAMTQVIATIGSNGNGTSAGSPLKFLIIVTDGLKSDRDANWTSSRQPDPAWNNYSTSYGGYAGTISSAQCQALKNNGIVLAVLETPYVPLDGLGSPVNPKVFPQDPPVHPYETTVRHVIYPNGPTGGSAVSAALSNCASSGYYYQANNSSDIATGFITLADKFIFSTAYVKH